MELVVIVSVHFKLNPHSFILVRCDFKAFYRRDCTSVVSARVNKDFHHKWSPFVVDWIDLRLFVAHFQKVNFLKSSQWVFYSFSWVLLVYLWKCFWLSAKCSIFCVVLFFSYADDFAASLLVWSWFANIILAKVYIEYPLLLGWFWCQKFSPIIDVAFSNLQTLYMRVNTPQQAFVPRLSVGFWPWQSVTFVSVIETFQYRLNRPSTYLSVVCLYIHQGYLLLVWRSLFSCLLWA